MRPDEASEISCLFILVSGIAHGNRPKWRILVNDSLISKGRPLFKNVS